MIKIMQNGIKFDGGYTPCFYSMGNKLNHSDKCIAIYARDYEHLPAELGNIHNDSDYQSDYFDSDKVYLEQVTNFMMKQLQLIINVGLLIPNAG